MKVNLAAGSVEVTLLGSLDNENGHWHWSCLLSAVLSCSACVACGWVNICVEQSVTPAVW
jgi:hypothetical protein